MAIVCVCSVCYSLTILERLSMYKMAVSWWGVYAESGV